MITSQYEGRCRQCGTKHKVGEQVYWTKGTKGVICLDCVASGLSGGPAPPISPLGAAYGAGPTFKGIPLFGKSWQTAAYYAQTKQTPPPGYNYNPQTATYHPPTTPAPTPPRPAPTATSQNHLALAALAALEALIMEMATSQMTPEMDDSWRKYQKIKALALNPGTAGEERAALKQAVIHAVKLAF